MAAAPSTRLAPRRPHRVHPFPPAFPSCCLCPRRNDTDVSAPNGLIARTSRCFLRALGVFRTHQKSSTKLNQRLNASKTFSAHYGFLGIWAGHFALTNGKHLRRGEDIRGDDLVEQAGELCGPQADAVQGFKLLGEVVCSNEARSDMSRLR